MEEEKKQKDVKQPQSQRILKIEETYKEGVRKHDVKAQTINKIIHDQNEEYHSRIRSEFVTRKMANDATNSRFYSRSKKNTDQV